MLTKIPSIEFIVSIRKKLQLIYKKKSLEVFLVSIYIGNGNKKKPKKTQNI